MTPAAAARQPVTEAADATAALTAAREQGSPVKIASRTTETDEVSANPDGTVTWRQSAQPERVLRDGTWRPVDLTLRRQGDGSVAPVAAAVDLRLSGGGAESPLVVAAREGYEVGLRWPGTLPEPALDGASARYAEVLPGVDLVVTASVLGFHQVLVVKTPEAARNPLLDTIAFGSHLRNASVREGFVDGEPGLQVRDAAGRTVFRGDASRMWDSTASGDHDGLAVAPGEGSRRASMEVDVSADTVAVRPDEAFLADPATTYPVYIDPEYHWAGLKNHHAVVQSGHPDARNYDVNAGDLIDLKAGRATDGSGTSRSYMEMNLTRVRGTVIKGATLRTRVRHSHSCSGGPTDVWLVGGIHAGTTWRNQPGWTRWLASNNRSNNAAYCPSDGGADFDVTGAVRDGAAGHWASVTLMLKAANESDTASWRRFDLNPVLEVRYNSTPNVPAEMSIEGGLFGCTIGPNRPVIATKTPRLRARLSDPDGGMMDAGFRVLRGPSGGATWDGNNKYTGNVPSGSFAEVRVDPGVVPADGIYTWWLWSGDYELVSYSPTCEFEVDTVVPGEPAVSSADFPPGVAVGGPGVTGAFTVKANGTADVHHYLYTVTEKEVGVPATRVDPPALGGDATIRFTPSVSGPQTLWVRSVDRAGNLSPVVGYRFEVEDREPLTPGLVGHWRFNGDGTDAGPGGRHLTAVAAPGFVTGYEDRATQLDGATQWLEQAAAVDTTKTFAVSAWARADRTGRWSSVVSQDGNRTSGFQLQTTVDGKWSFSMFGADADGGGQPHSRAVSTTPVQPGVWTHLTGVYDAGEGTLRLYVDGRRESQVGHRSNWNAAGSFLVGAAQWNGRRQDQFQGAVDEVRVYQRALVPAEAALLANQVVPRARYALDEGSGTSTVDSVTGARATLHGEVSWVTEPGSTAVRLQLAPLSSRAYVSGPRPAMRTDKSYTVSAWVRADTLDQHSRAVVSLGDPKFSPFLLGYRGETGKWGMLVSCSPTQACGTPAVSPAAATTGTWVHLTGVYDTALREARLYVNGELAGKTAGVTGWNGSGDLLIGRGIWTGVPSDDWYGSVDDVRLFSGVPTADGIRELARR
ncbi:LamG-like jellyroll fold domain-containing protein [Amycolatopsis suaedae]|uniref:LamG domain-containing protein n=1 Tax=Amycolatopsis suaedae TaxID=2510978 RepID=A0A4Q7J8H7_9PSEU|nr:LamG-like jellyroll fold domain-containing protein [Amycolatopsis suaedae]RZQ63509.1 LamG domain-containing protein [Amycolatopsis suaedae]